jgi:hypothetical protein
MPALQVTGNLKVTTSATENLTLGIGTGSFSQSASKNLNFTNGSGANKVGQNYTISRTAAGAPDNYTLSAIVDGLLRTIVFATIRMLVITNDDTVDGHTLLVGGATAPAWVGPFDDATATIKIPAGGILALGAPLLTAYPVIAGDKLKIDPGANTIPYTLHILGE